MPPLCVTGVRLAAAAGTAREGRPPSNLVFPNHYFARLRGTDVCAWSAISENDA